MYLIDYCFDDVNSNLVPLLEGLFQIHEDWRLDVWFSAGSRLVMRNLQNTPIGGLVLSHVILGTLWFDRLFPTLNRIFQNGGSDTTN